MRAEKLTRELDQYALVVVTGGSSGIGQSFIRTFANLRYRGLVCNLSRSDPGRFLEDAGVQHIPTDLTVADDLNAAKRSLQSILAGLGNGKIMLVNNSGFGSGGRFPRQGMEHHLNMLDLNVRALVDLSGWFLPVMRERGGAIVNIASTAAFQPTPMLATYGATKAFVLHWSLALSYELRHSGVQVLCVCPGPTRSAFFRRAGYEEAPRSPGRGMEPDRVARETLVALIRRRVLVVNGLRNRLIASMMELLPSVFQVRLAGAVLSQMRPDKDADGAGSQDDQKE